MVGTEELACMTVENEIRDAILRLNDKLSPKWEVIELTFDPRTDCSVRITIDER